MPVRRLARPLFAALLAGACMGGSAFAQGVLLPPGEVMRPSAGVPGAAQPTPYQMFAPQAAVPAAAPPAAHIAPATPPAAQAAPAQAAPAQAAAPQAVVPLPVRRPAAADAPPAQSAPTQSASAAKPTPITPAPSAPTQGDQDRAPAETIAKVADTWNKVQMLSGTFVQVDPDGTRKTGDFYMQKPGRVRFEYNAPVPLELVSNGQSVAVRDRKLNTQDITPLSQTPLRFLLAERFDLANDPHVIGTYQDNLYITVVMEEKVPMIGTYRLMLLFDAKTYALKQWIVTDPQGYDTSVAISNLDYTRRPDPKLFVINFERMLQ